MSSYYITTPIYYVNAEPHLGHAYTTIAADVASRHARQRGDDTFFLTGTDEHGAKVAQAAADAGLDPKAWADPIAERFRDLARRLEADYDFFIRTTDPEHEQFVQRFVTVLRERGHLFEGTYSGLYCTACEQFYREEELVDGKFCPQHGTVPEWTEEKNLFFRLSAFQDQLLAYYDAHPEFILPRGRMNETRAFVEAGLEDLSITRQGVSWGVPVPWDTAQSIYVWVDALLNYASAPTYARPGEDLSERFWPPRWQVLGKDILRFHAIIWPAMLMAAGYELPRQLYIHGYLLGHDGHRMSKTRGNGMDPYPAIDTYGADALRFYLLREVGFGQDGSIGYATMHDRYHSELANELGNLVNRSTAMIERYRGGAVPDVAVDATIAATCDRVSDGYASRLDRLDFTGALDQAWELVRALNRFVEERAPWTLARSDEPEQVARLDETLRTLADGIHVLGVVLYSVMPSTCARLLAAVGADPADVAWESSRSGALAPDAHVDSAAAQLFPRIESPPVAA
jgi:methionyl-tRNA synthetase